jgi:uncharacterized protein
MSLGGWSLAVYVVVLMLSEPLDVPIWAPLLAVALWTVAIVVVLPELRWRRWRYEIRDDEIDLRRGAITVTRTVIPIRRVQHVETEVGWLQDSFGLATVTFYTAAGGTSIPAIGVVQADEVRRRVTERAKALDDV